MTGKYEVRIGKNLQAAWDLFLLAPELYVSISLAQIVVGFILSKIPGLSFFSWIITSAFYVPAVAMIADASKGGKKPGLDCLKPLGNLLPQLLMISLLQGVLSFLGFLCLLIPGIYLMIAYKFSSLICLLEGKTFWDSMEGSRALVRGHWFAILGLAIVDIFLMLGGVLMLGVGILLAMPCAALLVYSVYLDIKQQQSGQASPSIIDAEIVT